MASRIIICSSVRPWALIRPGIMEWPQSKIHGRVPHPLERGVKVVIQAALAKVEGVVKGAVKIIARLTYRQRYEQSTGRDPFRCPHCQGEMDLWRIWHPTYGVIYDEGEVIKRGTYASSAQRAGP